MTRHIIFLFSSLVSLVHCNHCLANKSQSLSISLDRKQWMRQIMTGRSNECANRTPLQVSIIFFTTKQGSCCEQEMSDDRALFHERLPLMMMPLFEVSVFRHQRPSLTTLRVIIGSLTHDSLYLFLTSLEKLFSWLKKFFKIRQTVSLCSLSDEGIVFATFSLVTKVESLLLCMKYNRASKMQSLSIVSHFYDSVIYLDNRRRTICECWTLDELRRSRPLQFFDTHFFNYQSLFGILLLRPKTGLDQEFMLF